MDTSITIDGSVLPWIFLGLGVVIAFLGQRLVRLAIAVAGFGAGYLLVETVDPTANSTLQLVLAVAVGAFVSFLAVRSFRLMAAIAGGVFLGLAAGPIAERYLDVDGAWWIGFGIALVLGFLLVGAVFETGIRLATAVGGGVLVANALVELVPSWDLTLRWIVAAAVAVLGFLSQTRSAPSS